MFYNIIKYAIERKHSLSGKYEYYIRHFSPHALGDDREGRKCVLGFQYAGGRPGRLPPAGEWCFFLVDGLMDLQPNDDLWLAGPMDAQPLRYLSVIDVQVPG